MWKVLLTVGIICFATVSQARVVDQSVMDRMMNHKSLSELIKNKPEDTRKDLICLALNAYHEARSSTVLDQTAITFTAKNRFKAKYRGNDICEVVWYWKQFSWTHDGKTDFPKEPEAWSQAQRVAYMVYYNEQFGLVDPTGGRLHYVHYTIVNKAEKLARMVRLNPTDKKLRKRYERLKWIVVAENKIRIGQHVHLTE